MIAYGLNNNALGKGMTFLDHLRMLSAMFAAAAAAAVVGMLWLGSPVIAAAALLVGVPIGLMVGFPCVLYCLRRDMKESYALALSGALVAFLPLYMMMLQPSLILDAPFGPPGPRTITGDGSLHWMNVLLAGIGMSGAGALAALLTWRFSFAVPRISAAAAVLTIAAAMAGYVWLADLVA